MMNSEKQAKSNRLIWILISVMQKPIGVGKIGSFLGDKSVY